MQIAPSTRLPTPPPPPVRCLSLLPWLSTFTYSSTILSTSLSLFKWTARFEYFNHFHWNIINLLCNQPRVGLQMKPVTLWLKMWQCVAWSWLFHTSSRKEVHIITEQWCNNYYQENAEDIRRKTWSNATLSTTKFTVSHWGLNLGPPGNKPALNRPSFAKGQYTAYVCMQQGQDLSPLHVVQTGPGAHPASYPTSTGGSVSGVKRPGRGANHSPPSSAEVKNTWIYTSTPPYVFMV
jgi:hypothetical protein